jgi:hypothetical protein
MRTIETTYKSALELAYGMVKRNMSGASVTCKPENVGRYALAMEKANKVRKAIAPRKARRDTFPAFVPGMSTALYCEKYDELCRLKKGAIEYTERLCAPAPLLDPDFIKEVSEC